MISEQNEACEACEMPAASCGACSVNPASSRNVSDLPEPEAPSIAKRRERACQTMSSLNSPSCCHTRRRNEGVGSASTLGCISDAGGTGNAGDAGLDGVARDDAGRGTSKLAAVK